MDAILIWWFYRCTADNRVFLELVNWVCCSEAVQSPQGRDGIWTEMRVGWILFWLALPWREFKTGMCLRSEGSEGYLTSFFKGADNHLFSFHINVASFKVKYIHILRNSLSCKFLVSFLLNSLKCIQAKKDVCSESEKNFSYSSLRVLATSQPEQGTLCPSPVCVRIVLLQNVVWLRETNSPMHARWQNWGYFCEWRPGLEVRF
jgi:hypothetical protein